MSLLAATNPQKKKTLTKTANKRVAFELFMRLLFDLQYENAKTMNFFEDIN
jgi:hypothetical protein